MATNWKGIQDLAGEAAKVENKKSFVPPNVDDRLLGAFDEIRTTLIDNPSALTSAVASAQTSIKTQLDLVYDSELAAYSKSIQIKLAGDKIPFKFFVQAQAVNNEVYVVDAFVAEWAFTNHLARFAVADITGDKVNVGDYKWVTATAKFVKIV